MQTENLPTEELKKFGIINEDLSFSKKLKADDIQKFLQGYTIVADNDKNRAIFQLTENNTRLKVIFLERDKSISEILKNSKDRIVYSNIQNLSNEERLALEQLEKENYENDVSRTEESFNTFNPNDLSLEEWVELGFSERQAEVIFEL